MISYLTGTVFDRSFDNLTVLVGGVGYAISCPSDVLQKQPVGSDVSLHIYSHIREECFDLYGFPTKDELNLFKLLISVSGIGPKTGLGIMNKGTLGVKNAISRADTNFFMGIPRLGQKNAQKIIIELKNKVGNFEDLDLASFIDEADSEVIQALVAVGYSMKEAKEAINQVPKGDYRLEEKIKMALKNKNKKNL